MFLVFKVIAFNSVLTCNLISKKETKFQTYLLNIYLCGLFLNYFCQALLFGCFVIEIADLLTADTMGQRLCLQHE